MSADAYSAFKAVHHFVDGSLPPYPTHVQLVISDYCSQDCGFCAYRMSGYTSNQMFGDPDDAGRTNPKRMIPYEKIEEILDDCADMGVRAIQLTGGGEPTMHPRYVEVMSGVLERGMELALVTNGMTLSDEAIDKLALASWVRVSLDAGTDHTYAATRGVSKDAFLRVLRNVQKLVKARNNVGSSLEIGIGYVMTPDNWLEVLDAARIAKANGVDNFRISAMFSQDDDKPFQHFFDQAAELCRGATELQTETFRVYNRFGERVEDMHQHSPDYAQCGYQHLTTYVGGDQNVYRCCNTAYNERGLLGSLKGQGFRELWDSQPLEPFDARGCARCQFNGINRFINYATSTNPMHGAFV